MKRYGENLNVYYKVKEADLKNLHNIGFQLYDTLERGKTLETLKRSVVARGSEVGAGRNRGVSARTWQPAGERGAEDSSMGSDQAL